MFCRHSFARLEFERDFEQINEHCVVKGKQKFQFTGPNGSGDEHIIWIHEFDFLDNNSTYSLGKCVFIQSKELKTEIII